MRRRKSNERNWDRKKVGKGKRTEKERLLEGRREIKGEEKIRQLPRKQRRNDGWMLMDRAEHQMEGKT